MQALVAAGHILPKHINQFARIAFDTPLSVVRWLLQQGMTFENEMLMNIARFGRVDILQLAHSIHVPITADMIAAAAISSHWNVVIWACRNDVPVDCACIQQWLGQIQLLFQYPEQQEELLSLLRHTSKHQEQRAQGDRAGAAIRPQKRRKSKR